MATTKKLMRSNPNRYLRAGRRVEGTAGPDYPRVHRQHHPRLSRNGHAARQLTNADYEKYDLLIGMDRANLLDMYRICGNDFTGKLYLLMDHSYHHGTPTISK